MTRALNEGRGVNPGDTNAASVGLAGFGCGARAGGRPPRPLNEGRGVNPGDTAAGVGRGAEDVERSTKAGA